MRCPCIDCTERQAPCHDYCARFAEYRKPLDAASAQRALAWQVGDTLADMYRRTSLAVGRMARRCAAARE